MSYSTITTAFVDIATFDELEKFMYNGPDATAYFVRHVKKSTWFALSPVVLTSVSGTPAFGQTWSVEVSRSGDYLVNMWLRVTLPAVTLDAGNTHTTDGRLRWTRNLMHNLVQEANITFNDMAACRLDSYHLDFWAAFTTPASKSNGYDNMIGNTADLIQPHAPGAAIPSVTLNLPLPFFFGRDSGYALPTAALPYNVIRANVTFRPWNQLLILDNQATGASGQAAASDLTGGAPVVTSANIWATYAVVSNVEREKMGCDARTMLIEQVQTAPIQTFTPATNQRQSFDLRFSHAVKAMFFAVRNTTNDAERSNYTCASPIPGSTAVNFAPSGATDPILQTSLIYESSQKLSQMGSDYFSLIQPWFFAPSIPEATGYHLYSYSLDFFDVDPKGSTNFGKLNHISIVPEASPDAVLGANGTGGAGSGLDSAQTYENIVTVVNNNVAMINGGTFGFPSV